MKKIFALLASAVFVLTILMPPVYAASALPNFAEAKESGGISEPKKPPITDPIITIGYIAQVEGDEGYTLFNFFVERWDLGPGNLVYCTYYTEDGTATAEEDYEPVKGSFWLGPGEERTIGVKVYDKRVAEENETFYVVIKYLDECARGTGTILNDDTDLDVGWIHRSPEKDYVWGSTEPDIEGWPVEGQNVTWETKVINWGTTWIKEVPYEWRLDGEVVESGTLEDVPPGEHVTADYNWTWTFNRHELEFVLDPDKTIDEAPLSNNNLTIYTDAIAVGFYVEQSVYDYFRQYQNELGIGSNSWEDWAQRQIARFNEMFQSAVYEDTPNGVLDRVRLDAIHIVPDGALPLVPGYYPTNCPNRDDRTIDLQWGFPNDLLETDFYSNVRDVTDTNAFYFEGSLLHELGHARYLIDTYAFNAHDNGTGNTVAIRENGALIVGTDYMPIDGEDLVHHTTVGQGLMGGHYTFPYIYPYSYIDHYSAMALNLIEGHRATLGNCNAPENIGVFRNDLPSENRLTIKDQDGNILPIANVEIYQATGKDEWYGKYFDDVPDISGLITDDQGQVLLGQCPFDDDGDIDIGYGICNGTIIMRVEHNDGVGYGFLESTEFNMEYWRGNTDNGNYESTINISIGHAEQFVPPTELTELNAENWTAWAQGATASVTDDTSNKVVGAGSIRMDTDGGFDTYVRYPRGIIAHWDLSSVTHINVSFYADNPNLGFQHNSPWIRVGNYNGDYIELHATREILNECRNVWRNYTIPFEGDSTWERSEVGTPDLTDINYIEIHADTWDNGFSLWLDGLSFSPQPEPITVPDLVITEKWGNWPDNCTICYNVTNIGKGTAHACHNTTLYVDGTAVAHDHVPVDLAPGESYIGCCYGYTWTYTPPSDGITVCADNNNTVEESNETNNCLPNIWMCGDVNCDGKVTMSDVRKVFNRYLNPNYPLDLPWAADVNCDGKVTMSDVRKVFNRYLDPGYELNCCCIGQ